MLKQHMLTLNMQKLIQTHQRAKAKLSKAKFNNAKLDKAHFAKAAFVNTNLLKLNVSTFLIMVLLRYLFVFVRYASIPSVILSIVFL